MQLGSSGYRPLPVTASMEQYFLLADSVGNSTLDSRDNSPLPVPDSMGQYCASFLLADCVGNRTLDADCRQG
jgi:hypothetical protein